MASSLSPLPSAVLRLAGLISGSHGAMPQQRLVAVRKWRLGTTTRGHPSAIVADVLRTLQAHRIAWKKVGPYTYKCRKVLQLSSAPQNPLCARLEGHIHASTSLFIDAPVTFAAWTGFAMVPLPCSAGILSC